MAYDGYRSPPPAEQPGFYDYADPRPLQSAVHYSDLERQRSRDMPPSSDTYTAASVRHSQTRQPIDDAVASAFGSTDKSNTISPEILSQLTSQITASVIQQLKATTIQPPSDMPHPAHNSVPVPPSLNTTSEAIHPGSVHNPPSPQGTADDPAGVSVSSPTQSSHARFSQTSQGRSSPAIERRVPSPISQASQASQVEEDIPREAKVEKATRPRGPIRLSTGREVTTLEKVWGTLFDEEANSTKRLGQFLRGIAAHLIDDYEPTHSLVITPSKMQKYYEDTKLSSEIYPWRTIFDDHTSSISRLYREVEAEHHLVQEKFHERPDIPGLTPRGFERWVTLLLLANPDQEFERLQKAVLAMPVSNPDDKKERFPKEISRRLFPTDQNHQIREKIEKAMTTHCNFNLSRKHSIVSEPQRIVVPPTPTHQPVPSDPRQDFGTSSTPARFSPPPAAERQRQPYSNTPSEAATDEDDDDNVSTPQPIERERKPYSSLPGGGKNFDDVKRPPTPPDHRSGPTNRADRSGSNPSNARPIPINTSRQHQVPVDGYPLSPEPSQGGHHRTYSMRDQQSPARQIRNRSPSTHTSVHDYGHRSEGDVSYGVGAFSPSYWPSAVGDVSDDGRRAREYDRERTTSERHDAGRASIYDVAKEREREREPRARFQSTSGVETSKSHHNTDEDYYRASGSSYPASANGYQQYPSGSSYR